MVAQRFEDLGCEVEVLRLLPTRLSLDKEFAAEALGNEENPIRDRLEQTVDLQVDADQPRPPAVLDDPLQQLPADPPPPVGLEDAHAEAGDLHEAAGEEEDEEGELTGWMNAWDETDTLPVSVRLDIDMPEDTVAEWGSDNALVCFDDEDNYIKWTYEWNSYRGQRVFALIRDPEESLPRTGAKLE